MTFAIFISSEKIPELKDLFKTLVKGLLIKLMNFFHHFHAKLVTIT